MHLGKYDSVTIDFKAARNMFVLVNQYHFKIYHIAVRTVMPDIHFPDIISHALGIGIAPFRQVITGELRIDVVLINIVQLVVNGYCRRGIVIIL